MTGKLFTVLVCLAGFASAGPACGAAGKLVIQYLDYPSEVEFYRSIRPPKYSRGPWTYSSKLLTPAEAEVEVDWTQARIEFTKQSEHLSIPVQPLSKEVRLLSDGKFLSSAVFVLIPSRLKIEGRTETLVEWLKAAEAGREVRCKLVPYAAFQSYARGERSTYGIAQKAEIEGTSIGDVAGCDFHPN